MTALSRLARAERIRTIALATFETVADRRSMVRRREVYGVVAAALNEMVNNRFAREVLQSVKVLGWIALKPQNRRMFGCVRRRT